MKRACGVSAPLPRAVADIYKDRAPLLPPVRAVRYRLAFGMNSNRRKPSQRPAPLFQPTAAQREQGMFHIVYEMLILASALLVRDKRYFVAHYAGMQWGPMKIADDVIRLKSRLFRDFLVPGPNPDPRDMVVSHFGLSLPPLTPPPESKDFRDRIENTGTAHLSWNRIRQAPPTRADREKMETHALWLLTEARKFVDLWLAGGGKLNRDAAVLFSKFCEVHGYLSRSPRTTEDAPRPRPGMTVTVPIRLETLSA